MTAPPRRSDGDAVLVAVLTAVFTALVVTFLLVRSASRWAWRSGRWAWRWSDLFAPLCGAGVAAFLAWPHLGSWALVPSWPAAPLPLVAVVVLTAGAVVFWLRCPWPWWAAFTARRAEGRERLAESRAWGTAALASEFPETKLHQVRVIDEVVTGRVELPPGVPMPAFLKARDVIVGNYPAHRKHGPVERLFLTPCAVNASKHATFTLIRRPLRLPAPLGSVPAARGSSYRLGRGFLGDVWWDLELDSHAGVFGPTRSGKGNLVRYWALQALHAGQHVDVVDGTGSREWEPLLAYGDLFRWRPYHGPGDEPGFYRWALDTVNAFGSDVATRNARIGRAGFDNFNQAAKARALGGLRRRLLIVDEASSTLLYGGQDKRVADAVKELSGLVDAAAKAAAKAGGHVVVMDQLPYAGATGLAQATRAQLGRWVATGPVPDVMRPAVSGLSQWPFDTPPGQGFAATGRRGLSAEMVVIPEVGRSAVRPA